MSILKEQRAKDNPELEEKAQDYFKAVHKLSADFLRDNHLMDIMDATEVQSLAWQISQAISFSFTAALLQIRVRDLKEGKTQDG